MMNQQQKKPKIKAIENGPLVVNNPPPFFDWNNQAYPNKKILSLCRCGASQDKPYCDGSHSKIGFISKKRQRSIPDKRDVYKGKTITIYDNRAICSHAGVCTDTLKSVWRMGIEPWIDPDGAKKQAIIDVIKKCPSGALSYDDEHNSTDEKAKITVAKDGPFQVCGDVPFEQTAWGDGANTKRYALCRCGDSKNKPFCDGSHWYKDFQDDDTVSAEAHARPDASQTQTVWYKVAQHNDVPEGRVKTVTAGTQTIALTHFNGSYGALANKCPHQGGPLGEGSIENCYLRCPWHGWDFDPLSGKARKGSGYDDVPSFPIEKRKDGLYVAVEEPVAAARTVSNVMVETMVNWGIKRVFGMVGHSNLGLADAIRQQEQKDNLTFVGIRHEGAAAFACSGYAKLCAVNLRKPRMLDNRRTRGNKFDNRTLGCPYRPSPTARLDWTGENTIPWPWCLPRN